VTVGHEIEDFVSEMQAHRNSRRFFAMNMNVVHVTRIHRNWLACPGDPFRSITFEQQGLSWRFAW
jgi:hypothetical protein